MACDTHSFLQRFHCPAHLDLGSFLPSMLALALVRCRSIHSSCAKRLPHSCASASTSRCRHFRANKRVYTRWIFTPALPHSSWPRTSKRWAVVSTYSTEVVVCTPPPTSFVASSLRTRLTFTVHAPNPLLAASTKRVTFLSRSTWLASRTVSKNNRRHPRRCRPTCAAGLRLFLTQRVQSGVSSRGVMK